MARDRSTSVGVRSVLEGGGRGTKHAEGRARLRKCNGSAGQLLEVVGRLRLGIGVQG